MGIDSVAIKTFNSTGSQSICRTNTSDDTKAIESQFLTKCKTEYINGSGMSFIVGSLTALPSAAANTETYFLPSDVDAISEILLQMRFKCTAPSGDEQVSTTLLLDLINKIEMKVGNLTYQTIFAGDIYARNLTENGNLMKLEHAGAAAPTNGLHTDGTYFDFSVSVPFTGRNSDLKGAFLQAGAVTNGLTMKVTYNQLPGSATGDGIHNLIMVRSITDFSTGICVFSHQITDTEKNFLQNNIVNRVVKASQGIRSLQNFTSSRENTTLTVDLSNININVSHILLTLERGAFGIGVTPLASLTVADVNTGTCWRPRDTSANINANTIGVLKGWLKNAELVIGNDRTGNIPASCITTNRIEQFGLTSVDNKNVYIIKLAGSAFSTAGIPFARLNNKKLILTFNILEVANLSGTGSLNDQCVLNVTCCGTQVQTTVSGSMSFSA